MSRWQIEKSGSGIEKSGSGIEKSGSGIEKNDSGIEKSGTGLRKTLLSIALFAISLASQVSASTSAHPEGNMQIVVNDQNIAVSWIIDGSVFSGVANLSGSFANLALTEIGLAQRAGNQLKIAGDGSGIEVAGDGSGIEVAGDGSGIEVAGDGSGIEVAGDGSGIDVAGDGSGSDSATDLGAYANDFGNSTSILVAGDGSGSDAIVITLPGGTDMQMEVSLSCNSASVSILDSNFAEVVSFANVPVFGASSYCQGNGGGISDFYNRAVPVAMNDRR
jgi:hypothetical protein